MTLQEAQNTLHAIYQGDTSTPATTTDEWAYRLILLNEGISQWEKERGVLWDELWTTLADASSGDDTTVAATTAYDMPDDFVFLGSYVKVGGLLYEVIPSNQEENYSDSSRVCYVTGNRSSGYKLNFLEAPEAGETIAYPYYKTPTDLANTTDIIEMSDPYFCVNWALYRLRANDGDGQLAAASRAEALGRLRAMKLQNDMLPANQPNQPIDTQEGFGYEGSWGVSRFGEPL
jgi:hypothetical protein